MSKKLGRNEPCWCGSGIKYKRCCIDRGLAGVTVEEVSVEALARAGIVVARLPGHRGGLRG